MKTTYSKSGIDAARLDIPIGILDPSRHSGVRYLQDQLMPAILPSDAFDCLLAQPIQPAAFTSANWLTLDLEDFAHSLS